MPTNPTTREDIRHYAKSDLILSLHPKACAAITEDLDELDRVRAELVAVRVERDRLRSEVNGLNDTVSIFRAELDAARAARDEARTERDRLRSELGAAQVTNFKLAAELVDLKAVRAELGAARAARDEANDTNFKLAAELEQYRRGDLVAPAGEPFELHPDDIPAESVPVKDSVDVYAGPIGNSARRYVRSEWLAEYRARTAYPDGIYEVTVTYPGPATYTHAFYRIDGEWKASREGDPVTDATITNAIRIGDIPA